MALLAPASPVRGTGWLHGWRLTFAGDDGVALASVVEDPDGSVFVVLYDITPGDEQALDSWEDLDLGRWRKIRVRVRTGGQEVLAWLYVLDAYEGGLPTADQLQLLADAARAGGAPPDYVARLRQHPCADEELG
jgi:gamma-glutamylcyclotransferase (GGCT)/AIG2-like uncharacterized protein YtfP